MMGKWKADLKVREKGDSVAVQWLGLCAFTAKGPSSIPGWGVGELRFCKPISTAPSPQKERKYKTKDIEETSLCFGENPKISHHIHSPSPGRFFSPIPLLDLYQINLSPYYCSKLLSQNSFPTYLLCRKGYHSTLHTPPSLIFIFLNFNPLS